MNSSISGGLLQNTPVNLLTETIKFAERRHQILASNIANLDTPGYKTQDLSVENFQSALAETLEAKKTSTATNSPFPGHANSRGVAADQAQHHLHNSYEQILYHDGSDVSMEQQVTNISKNQAMHSTAIAILRQQMNQLKMAITESVNV